MKDEPARSQSGRDQRPSNARDLHAFLEVGKDFSNWMKDRIEQYGFVENQDFVIGSPVWANQSGRGGDRRSKDYHLTLDMGKELAMVERNEKGKQARQYFLECERRAKAAQSTYSKIGYMVATWTRTARWSIRKTAITD